MEGTFPGACLPFYLNSRSAKPYKDWVTRFHPPTLHSVQWGWSRAALVPRYHVWSPEAESVREVRDCGGRFERAACVLGVADVATLTRLPHLFAHKFRLGVQPAALQCLREWHCERRRKGGWDLDWLLYKGLPAGRWARARSPASFRC